MAYTLGNKYAKNLCKRMVLLQLIIENVVTCFFRNTVYVFAAGGMGLFSFASTQSALEKAIYCKVVQDHSRSSKSKSVESPYAISY